MKDLKIIEGLDLIVNQVLDGELSPTFAYSKMKDFEKALKNSFSKIDVEVKKQVLENPKEYSEFTISERKTYNYKENKEYNEKKEELKKIEEKLKIATDMKEKGDYYIDGDGVIIEPVSINYTEILTYKPKK